MNPKKLQQHKTDKKKKNSNQTVNTSNKHYFIDELLKNKTYTRFMTHCVIILRSNQRKLIKTATSKSTWKLIATVS